MKPAATTIRSSVLERYFARPEHGQAMVIRFEAFFGGQPVVDALQTAWKQTLQKYIKLSARLEKQQGSWVWSPREPEASPVRTVQAADSMETQAGSMPHPVLGVAANCLCRLDQRDRWSLEFLIHHACCDGYGVQRVIADCLKTYANLVSDQTSGSSNRSGNKPLSPEQAEQPVGTNGVVPDLRNVWKTIRGRNVRIRDIAVRPAESSELPEIEERGVFEQVDPCRAKLSLTEGLVGRIATQLRSQKITWNDWSVHTAMRAIAGLLKEQDRCNDWISVLNPVELRQWRDRFSPDNQIGIAYLRRQSRQLAVPHESLRSVCEELDSVRRHGTSRELENGLGFAERIPGLISLVHRTGKFIPTVSVTCLMGLRWGRRFGVRCHEGTWMLGSSPVRDTFVTAPMQAGGELAVAVWQSGKNVIISSHLAQSLSPQIHRVFLQAWFLEAKRFASSS